MKLQNKMQIVTKTDRIVNYPSKENTHEHSPRPPHTSTSTSIQTHKKIYSYIV